MFFVVDVPLFGLASMMTDSCSGEGPCPAGDQIEANYGFAVTALVGGLITLGVLCAVPRTRYARGPQIIASLLALLGGLWPVVWAFLLGGPRN